MNKFNTVVAQLALQNVDIFEAEKNSLIIRSLPKSMFVIATVVSATHAMTIEAIDALIRKTIDREKNPLLYCTRVSHLQSSPLGSAPNFTKLCSYEIISKERQVQLLWQTWTLQASLQKEESRRKKSSNRKWKNLKQPFSALSTSAKRRCSKQPRRAKLSSEQE